MAETEVDMNGIRAAKVDLRKMVKQRLGLVSEDQIVAQCRFNTADNA